MKYSESQYFKKYMHTFLFPKVFEYEYFGVGIRIPSTDTPCLDWIKCHKGVGRLNLNISSESTMVIINYDTALSDCAERKTYNTYLEVK